MEKNILLNKTLYILVSMIKKQDFLVYFRKISIVEITKEKVVFGVGTSFVKENIEAKFYEKVFSSTRQVMEEITKIEFVIDKNIDNSSNKNVIQAPLFYKEYLRNEKKTTEKNPQNYSINTLIANDLNEKKKSILEKFSLDNFIVGPSNQLAYSACEAIVKNPGNSYNPLYIYGDVGLGKTHLLMGTGNAIMKKYKGKVVKYMTSNTFISEYVNSVKKRSVERLRQKYEALDVLIIDDVQFFSKKEQTQNELYNIFNILYDSNKQIIISGDRSPKELTQIEPRLKSRFGQGIIADISKPDYETRLAILQEKSRCREFLIPQDVAEFIAANVIDNVRELEGILNQLIAEYELDGSIPTYERIAKKLQKLSFTTDILGDIKVKTNPITIKSYDDIITAVSNHFGIEKEGILGPNRKKEFMIPRQVSMYLLKTKLHYTYERIGTIFSGRNHAAVLYSCNKLESMLKKDKNLLYEINMLRDGIGI